MESARSFAVVPGWVVGSHSLRQFHTLDIKRLSAQNKMFLVEYQRVVFCNATQNTPAY